VKIKELIKIKDSLTNLAKIMLPKSVDNYNVFKLYKQVEDESRNYYIQRDKIVMEYGKKQSNGSISILSDNPSYRTAIKLIEELENIEVEMLVKSVKLQPADIKLSPLDLYYLTDIGLIEILEE